MQWNAGENAGFKKGTPWIKVNPNYKEINVESQVNDPDSVYNCYKNLIRIRNENDVIVYGEFEPLLMEDANVFAYDRVLNEEKIRVICNFSGNMVDCELVDERLKDSQIISNYKDVITGKLRPYEAFMVEIK